MPTLGNSMLSFSGVASGLDTDAIVKALVAHAHAPIDRLGTQGDTVRAQQGQVGKIRDLLAGLATLSGTLDTYSKFGQATAAATPPDRVAVTLGSDAAVGQFDLEVQQLATSFRGYSDKVASKSECGLLGSGTLTVQVGNGPREAFDIDASTSLTSLQQDIANRGLELTSRIMFDGSGYRLQLNGQATGSDNAVHLSETGSSTGFGLTANVKQQADDALVSVDHLPALRAGTNQVHDLVQGISLELKQVGSTSLEIGHDFEATVAHTEKFVAAYNDVMAALNKATQFGGTVDKTKLVGDTLLQNVRRNVQRTLSTAITANGNGPTTLSEVGFASQRDGSLALDRDKLTTALKKDFVGVSRLFVQDFHTQTQGLAARMQKVVQPYTNTVDGSLAHRDRAFVDQLKRLDQRKDGLQLNLNRYEQNLKNKFSNYERLMAKLNSQGAFSVANSIRPAKDL